MPTIAGIAYTHLIDGFSKGIDSTSPWVRAVYKIDLYDDTNNFCNALMGFGKSTGPITGPTVTRGVPHAYPLSTNLFCVSATVAEGLGQPILNANGYPSWDGGALIAVEYRPAPYNFSGADNTNQSIDPGTPLTWCTQSISYTTEVITVPSAVTTPPSIPASIKISNAVLSLTFHKLPYMPMTKVRSLIGRVNTVQFLGAGIGLVLFKGADTERAWNTDGSVVQEVKMIFHERPARFPWNSGPTQANPYTWTPVTDSNGNKPFDTGDLNGLLF
jgi:hypothetical protein